MRGLFCQQSQGGFDPYEYCKWSEMLPSYGPLRKALDFTQKGHQNAEFCAKTVLFSRVKFTYRYTCQFVNVFVCN
jgi:hypothetical protein